MIVKTEEIARLIVCSARSAYFLANPDSEFRNQCRDIRIGDWVIEVSSTAIAEKGDRSWLDYIGTYQGVELSGGKYIEEERLWIKDWTHHVIETIDGRHRLWDNCLLIKVPHKTFYK